MKITIICTSDTHPVNFHLNQWIDKHGGQHEVTLVRDISELTSGDILFMISCNQIIPSTVRSRYIKALVIHASDLPRGRGWSPHIWQIIDGSTRIAITLLEAEDKVDSGRIWHQIEAEIQKDALWDEINRVVFDAQSELMDFALENFFNVCPREQATDVAPSYYRKRTPADSRIDPNKNIAEQFDLIRVCDPDRFPAYFELDGHKYILKLEKIHD